MILRQSPGCCLCIILCFVVSHGTGLHFVPLVGALSSLSFPVRTRYWTVVCIEVWYRGLPVLTRCKHANVHDNPCTDFVVPSFGSFKHMGSKWGRTQVLRLSSVGQHLYFSVVVVAPSTEDRCPLYCPPCATPPPIVARVYLCLGHGCISSKKPAPLVAVWA